MDKHFPDPPAHIHIVGLKGVAMTALAEILQSQGYIVTGSDVAEIFPTDVVLTRLGIPCAEGFAAEHVRSDTSAVVYSTAYAADNVERRAADELGIPSWSYPEIVSIFFSVYSQSISIAGSHGKTTTTALIGHMLEEGGLDPTVIVGSTDAAWGSNARVGHSSWFILETDEFQNKFQQYDPRYVLITNVDYDHPDYFPDRVSYEEAFLEFVRKIPETGVLVLWGDDPMRLSLQSVLRAPLITYGQGEENAWRLVDVVVSDQGTTFSIVTSEAKYGPLTIPFAGLHYALNATGALALAHHVGVSIEAASRAITYFRGTTRRMQVLGEYQKAILIDDYAHHPTEVRATIEALRARYPDKTLRVVFHPHTFTRTAKFLHGFAEALSLADHVYLLPIFGSARETAGTVSSGDVAKAANQLSSGVVEEVSGIQEAIAKLRPEIGEHDVLVTMGAGDAWKIAEALLS